MVLRQPFVTPSAVEAFDVRVLLRLAKFDVFEADTPDLAQASMAGLMYSGPLSQRIAWGLLRQEMICVSALNRAQHRKREVDLNA